MATIKQVTYSSLANLGNYENEKIELTADLKESDDYLTVLIDLRQKVHDQLSNADEYYVAQHRIRNLKIELQELESTRLENRHGRIPQSPPSIACRSYSLRS